MIYNLLMDFAPLNNPVWVSRPADLRAMVADLLRYPIVAVDTESNGLYVYQEQVCLLQFSTGETDYLVDPLSLSDLSTLEPVFDSPAIQKVFHAAEYDVLCLKRDFGFRFANLFDTMLAARILGRKEFGLGALLLAEFGLELDKRHQRANWGRRPLPASMLAYARLDTHYLQALREQMLAGLEEKGLRALAEEDFQRMCAVPSGQIQPAVDNCWTVANPRDVNPYQAAILQALCAFRDRQARYANFPTFRILPNRALIDITLQAPQTLEELDAVPGLPGKTIERFGEGILAAVKEGQAAPPLHPPRSTRPPDAVLQRIELLREWRKEMGRSLGVESDVILPKDVLHEIAETNPRTPEALAERMQTLPWRRERFGNEILELLLTKKGKKTT